MSLSHNIQLVYIVFPKITINIEPGLIHGLLNIQFEKKMKVLGSLFIILYINKQKVAKICIVFLEIDIFMIALHTKCVMLFL